MINRGIYKRYLVIVIAIFIVVANQPLYSQTSKKTARFFEKARSAYLKGETLEAVKFAKQALESDNNHSDSHLLLADIYQSLDSVGAEIDHLKIVWENSKQQNSLLGYRLGEALFKTGDYASSLDIFGQSMQLGAVPEKRKKAIEKRILSCRFAIHAIQNPVAEEAVKLGDGVNSQLNEYWPSISIDGKQLVFTRLVGQELNKNILQEDFYISEYYGGKWDKAVPIEDINTPENEGAQSLTADGSVMFFAACNREDGLGSCDIYFTRKINGQWEKPRNAGKPVNSSSWESQPSVTANGNYLYFSSNRSGGRGKMDIWRCRLSGFNANGNPIWGIPENLGDMINTEGNENSPYIHFNGKDLYFSSNEFTGMGGADIFHSKLTSEGWNTPENLGYPVNTFNDEQGLVIDATGEKAYYSSDRDGNMDIYSFDLYKEIQPTPVTYIRGKVFISVTNEPVQASVEFIELGNGYSESILSGEQGDFLMALPLLNNYAFNVSKEGFLFYSNAFQLKNVHQLTDPYILNIGLQPISEGAKMVLNNIYFETDSYELLPESEPELLKLKELLSENPKIVVEVEGHTDDVGSSEYNQDLSEKRAMAVVRYLTDSGIDSERLSYKGFGYLNSVAENNTEEGRRKNRRTEIRIVKTN